MASNIILAVPTANSSVNYELPDSESAKLSFAPEDIDGLKLDANGGLNISFVEGGSVTITNFQSFIDNGNTLSLSDGTNVDPKVLFNALNGHNDNPFPTADVTKIGIPAEGTQQDITLESGKKYLFNFDLSETKGADIKDGKMVIGFENGGKIVVTNYETAMADKNPPELSLASKTCVVSGDELITNIQDLAKSAGLEQTALVLEEEEALKRKSKLADTDMDGKADIGPGDETALGYRAEQPKTEEQLSEAEARAANEIKTAAGEEAIAEQLAAIETAAGGAAAGGRANSGYGYGSRPGADPFITNPDIGPIDPTQLGYRAPRLEPGRFLDIESDDSPDAIEPDIKLVDETNLDNGPVSVSGKVNVDFGADGNGGISPNGGFSAEGSVDNGVLTSNGIGINVSVSGDTYTGTTTADDKVFDLVINASTGDYVFTQYLPLDHANATDPDDKILLIFGVNARDGDGDTTSTTIKINVADDGPSAEGASGTVDETDLGPVSISGNLTVDFGQDGPGRVETTGAFTPGGSLDNGVLTSSGVAVVVSQTANGYVGTANGQIVFDLSINESTGAFTYTQYKNLDHADNSDPNDVITLQFGTNVVDYDGDVAPAPITIYIKDDAPTFVDCGCGGPDGPAPGNAVETVDETNLVGGNLVETGTITADFGADAPGSYALKAGSFTSGGSKANGALTHNGVTVAVTLENGVYTGKAGDILIFTLAINAANGQYTYTQYDNFDHADGNDPNDVITLDFGVIASDFEGDAVEGSIRVNVKDDAPIANKDINAGNALEGPVSGNVVTGLNGGAGAQDTLSTDAPNKVVKIAFGGNEVDVPAAGTASIDGANGTLIISADGSYTYTAFDTTNGNNGSGSGSDEKEFTSGPALPDFDESEALDGVEQQSLGIAPGNLSVDEGDVVTVTFSSEVAGYSNTLGVFTIGADGKLSMETVLIPNGNQATPGQTANYTVGQDGEKIGFFLIADGATLNPGIDFSKGRIDFVYNYGQTGAREAMITDNGANVSLVYTSESGVETIVSGPVYYTSDRGDTANLNADDSVRVVSGLPDQNDNTVLRIGFEDLPQLGDKDYNDMVFDISIKDQSCACDCGGKVIRDEFAYTIVDSDGDKDTATLIVGGEREDFQPVIVEPGVEIVDETTLVSGVITETGNISVNFGGDGPGTVAGNNNFTSTGSKLGGNLTSGGVAVVVSFANGTYTGVAGGVTVFTMKIEAGGAYTFKLFEQLDHADGSNANDIINLNFGIVATDCDGDKSNTTVVVKVKDDAPDARDDSATLNEGGSITGNVTSNDVAGQDTPATVTKIEFGGTGYTVPANGTNLTVIGTYGTLVINKDGVYTYTSNNSAEGIDNFTYTYTDRDGDSDKAVLSICVNDIDTIPTIVKPADEILDETNLVNGPLTETGTVTADFKDDGPGSFAGNGSFTSGGSRTANKLTSNGVDVVVTYANGTYTAKAGTVTVFTLTVASNGTYEYKQFEQLDHADGNNPNDIINLEFGIDAIDADGDKASTTITVKVRDDAPDAKDDSRTVDEGQTINGNVTDNDVAGQDIPGKVIKVSFNGTNYDVPATGQLTIVGAQGTLKIDQTGAYSYTSKANANGFDNFTYTLKDFDGDTDTAILSICVNDTDTIPTIVKPADEILDETNLVNGPLTETGTITADFKDDGPGSFAGNGGFTSGGSRTANKLTSNGVDVVVTYASGVYTAKAGTVTVFTLTIASNGSYEYKQFEQLDHADGNNPNDIINLEFGIDAIDSDGDKASTTLTVKIKDDAPDAKDDGRTMNQGQTINGNVTDNDVVGQDIPGKVIKVSFNGTSYDVPATGQLTINGTYGTLKIDQAGAYTYISKAKVDGVDNFLYTLKDFDGDTDTACLSIDVNNNNSIPQIIKPADEIVDETNLVSGVLIETGTVTANFFTDGPGSFTGNGSFTSGGSRTANKLTSNGVDVVVTHSNGVYTAKAGTVTVFTLTIALNGSYEYKQFEQLDHADGTNPNDIINLEFGVKATDADGDTAATTITVKVKDDAPDARDDYNTSTENPATGNVITGLNGGPGAQDQLSQDIANKVVKISFGGTTVDVPATGTATIAGNNGTLKISADGSYTYTPNQGANSNGEEKTFVSGPVLPDFEESQALDGVEQQSLGIAAGNLSVGEGDIISVRFVDEQAGYSNTLGVFTIDANGNLKAETIVVPNSDTAGTATYTYSAGADATATGFFIIADGATVNNNYAGIDLSTGTLNFVYKYGTSDVRDATINDDGGNISLVYTSQSGVKTVLEGPLYFTSDRGEINSLNANGSVRVVSGLPDQNDNTVLRIGFEDLPELGDKDYNDVIFDVSIQNADCGCDNSDVFTYTLKDGDGDTDTATLTLDCIPEQDYQPSIIKPADEIVDETNLVSGVLIETGTVTANFFTDGPGSFTGNGSFTSGGSRTANKLTSNGVDVVVTHSNGVYTAKAGTVTVFTLTIALNGSYEYKQFEQLDHADGTNPNDIINLEFGVKATDADGDTAATTITVKVKDDAPDAKDDGRTTSEGQTINGNVTDNDVVGQDVPGKVIKVSFNGTSYDVPATGQLTINGTYGVLKIDQSGAYSYMSKANADGIDNFLYTLRDFDGDVDTACLSICVTDTDTVPSIIKPADEIVDETNLVNGPLTETGSVTADFRDDGPGSFTGNGSFASGGSRAANKLTSNGVDVVVTHSNGVYTAKAGTVTVFTLTIASNGTYEYKQFEQLDHADGNNPNDIINLEFGVKATDSDGDMASTTITVKVKDDAPDAKDDGRTVTEGETVTGNVTNNDIVGQDVPGKVIKVQFGSTTYDVPATGQLTINGTYGVLKIDQSGAYTYTPKANTPGGIDNFNYTLRDFDGDTDTACLSICVLEGDDQPSIIKPADEIVDETNLVSGALIETGTVTANFFADGPGSFTGNGSFTSGGSRTANKLTSNGVDVVVSHNNGVYTGTAGSVTVFTMTIASNGSYTYRQFEQLDHADGNNPNDIINLEFGVKATDADGDTAATTITVKVKDDAPTVVGDFCTIVGGETQVSSNALANDTIGQDTPGKIVSVTFGGTIYTVPASGTINITSLYGILTIAASGAYTYRVVNSHPGASEEFAVKVADFDGDTATSLLQINLVGYDLQGTSGRDTINGGSARDVMYGNDGDDWLYGNGGNDFVDGGRGDDFMKGDAGNDELVGREGNDTIYGGEGNDTVFGDGADTDTYAGNDTIFGDGGDDFIYGRRGDDSIDGGLGNDVLYGEQGNDSILGGAGADHIIGGAGNDILTGGTGADTFWYLAISEGVDRIKDFNVSEGDKLELSNVLTNFDPVTDAINDFVFANNSGGNTTISVNNSGNGAGGATTLLVLENVTVSVSDLFNNGSIIV